MRHNLIASAALLAALPAAAAEWGAVERRGDVEIFIAPVDPKPTHTLFGLDAPDKPGVLISVMSRNSEVTAFKVTLRYERDGKKFLRSVLLERGATCRCLSGAGTCSMSDESKFFPCTLRN